MNPLDLWTSTSRNSARLWSEAAIHRLDARLSVEPNPYEKSRQRQVRTVAACLSAAAICGFVTTGLMEWQAQAREISRWPAAAMEAAPSVLLVADRGR